MSTGMFQKWLRRGVASLSLRRAQSVLNWVSRVLKSVLSSSSSLSRRSRSCAAVSSERGTFGSVEDIRRQ